MSSWFLEIYCVRELKEIFNEFIHQITFGHRPIILCVDVCVCVLCTCVCMYVYIHTHTYIHTHIHTYIHAYIHTHTYNMNNVNLQVYYENFNRFLMIAQDTET